MSERVVIVRSIHGVPIRLPASRWAHIVEHHDDLVGCREAVLETITRPDCVVRGKEGELLALRSVAHRTLVVAYRELSKTDGFVITAFSTTAPERIQKRGLVWLKH